MLSAGADEVVPFGDGGDDDSLPAGEWGADADPCSAWRVGSPGCEPSGEVEVPAVVLDDAQGGDAIEGDAVALERHPHDQLCRRFRGARLLCMAGGRRRDGHCDLRGRQQSGQAHRREDGGQHRPGPAGDDGDDHRQDDDGE